MGVAITILFLNGLQESAVSERDGDTIRFTRIAESIPCHVQPPLWKIPAEINFVRSRTSAISVVIVIRLRVYGLLHIFKHGHHFVLTDFLFGLHDHQPYQVFSANARVVDCDRARTEYGKFTLEGFLWSSSL